MASQHPDIEKVLFTQEDIEGIVSRLGEEITRDYAGKDLVLIAVLRGAVVFMGDLMLQDRAADQHRFHGCFELWRRCEVFGHRAYH